jgi:hypothetical protein
MAQKLKERIVKAVGDAMMERDRAEMRAMDAVLSVVERPPRRRRVKIQRKSPARRRK